MSNVRGGCGTPAIRMEALTKRFGSVVALDDLTLDVAEGEVFGFLGPNGAGKSTTLRLLLGLIKPTAGRAEIKGIDVARTTDVHRHLAYVPGDVSLWPRLTGEECLELFARLQGGVDETVPQRARRSVRTRLVEARPGLLQGQPSEGCPRRRVLAATGRAAARRADERPRSVDGAAVPAVRPRGDRARPDDLPVVAHPLGGRGAVRAGRHPPCGSTRRGVVGRRRSARCTRASWRSTSTANRPTSPTSMASSRSSAHRTGSG